MFPSLAVSGRGQDGGVVSYRGQERFPLEFWRNLRPAPEEIIVVGSGPSVNSIDFSRMPEGSCLLVNGAITLASTHGVKPLAIAIEDERFIWRYGSAVIGPVATDIPCLFSAAVIRCLFEQDRNWWKGRDVVLVDDVRKPVGLPRRSETELSSLPFLRRNEYASLSLDPDRGVAIAGSVAFSAFQFTLACQPERLGIVGVDISNANEPRFNESSGNVAPSGIVRGQQRLLSHFALGLEVAREAGISVFNYSPISALSKIDYPYDSRYAKA